MRNTQRGVSLMALIAVLFILVIAGIFAMKVVPSFLEFRSAKTAINAIAKEKQGASVADIRKSFDARAQIDDITAIKSGDLEITKEGNEVIVGFGYRKEVKLFGPLSLVIDYAATSRD